jgi:isoaspartyl peptidase/L-asparaginase-like protein (Ntn-hydrolase superfamily)
MEVAATSVEDLEVVTEEVATAVAVTEEAVTAVVDSVVVMEDIPVEIMGMMTSVSYGLIFM